ncbi:FUSC family protein [Granulicella mallensis]|uniref:Putative membrane protein YccC n=1 Tax=Granulicella mallensis TaxID=940614 RepID=A0A7W7ZMU3_9BACT|nr:FUSC family protein [Granulicella mallensis]MBB5062489.1 putative membrane protein YccC [Granulicella mallensis]
MPTARKDSHTMHAWPSATAVFRAVFHGVMLSVFCAISYWLITHLLSGAFSVSRDDDLLGGMWAVAATVFVYRYSYDSSVGAAASRMWATLLSFGLCLIYLLFFPFSLVGMVTLIGLGAITMSLFDRADEIVTTGITTAVIMVVAGLSPHPGWKQPILRLIDTVVGVGVGVAGVWITSKAKSSGPEMLRNEPQDHA